MAVGNIASSSWSVDCRLRTVDSFKIPIDLHRKLVVLFRDHSGVVRGKPDFNGIVYVGPPGMVVHFFGNEGHVGHEGKGIREIFEFKFLVQCVPFFGPHIS